MVDAHIPLTLVDWLDDLCVRFLVNLPQSELSSVPRLCFQVEEAQWFYEDFVRPAVQASGAPPLPHLPLRQFCLLIFQHCPLLSGFTDAQHLAAYEDFLAYKVRVPVRGAILLDQNMEKLVLVRGWKKGASWSFPRGKINKDERDLDCAIREVYEETGFDLSTSGLIPNHEEDIKYIDVTMREQHMRLFVFRGVPEDTYFETKTRKEISKIQWYWIKDLPGFKKQNRQQQNEADAVHANKFYMVAPFLGHLKKWIGQQRKKDTVDTQRQASSMHGTGLLERNIGIEDESEDHQYVGVSVGQKEDELKRLFSIGAASGVQNPAVPDIHSGNLLAMLQGGAAASNGQGQPHTPFEQINAFPPQPETPQPQHLRQPSMGQQLPPPPQFPYSPQRLPFDQEPYLSQPTPAIFGPRPAMHGYAPTMQAGMPLPHFQQQQFQQRQPMPFATPFEQQNIMAFNNGVGRPPMPSQQLPMPPQQIPIPLPHPLSNTQPSNAFMAQGSQGAIASGPAVPNASQLPAPNLSAHTKQLLDAFKTGYNRPTAAPGASAKAAPRATSTHQAALLDLFKKPGSSTPLSTQPTPEPAKEDPPSPAPTDTTVRPRRPSKAQERKPTLNEITRTLPLKPKAKATPPPESPIVHDRSLDTRPKSRQLFDPNESDKSKAAKATGTTLNNPPSPVKILQRPSSSLRSSPPTNAKAAGTSSSPSMHDSASKQNGHQTTPAFTILTRPGSSRGTNVPPAPSSLLKNETSTPPFKPMVVAKRGQQLAADVEPEKTQTSGSDSKDQLLALFGKGSGSAHSTISVSQAPVSLERKASDTPVDSKTTLLDLFKGNTPKPAAAPAAAVPPPAPRIQPTSSSTKPTSQAIPATSTSTANKQQSLLLDLFNKPSTTTPAAAGHSPSTPISPFALGTPMTSQHPQTFSSSIAGTLTTGVIGKAGREGRLSAAGAGTGTGAGSTVTSPTASTPAQAKEFLMGYLNGVVRGEGGGSK